MRLRSRLALVFRQGSLRPLANFGAASPIDSGNIDPRIVTSKGRFVVSEVASLEGLWYIAPFN